MIAWTCSYRPAHAKEGTWRSVNIHPWNSAITTEHIRMFTCFFMVPSTRIMTPPLAECCASTNDVTASTPWIVDMTFAPMLCGDRNTKLYQFLVKKESKICEKSDSRSVQRPDQLVLFQQHQQCRLTMCFAPCRNVRACAALWRELCSID